MSACTPACRAPCRHAALDRLDDAALALAYVETTGLLDGLLGD